MTLIGLSRRSSSLQRLRQIADGRGRRLLHEDVAGLRVLEGVQHQVDRVVERHQEARHRRDR